ncbi:radical SAM protein [bacterium]|nr:radical SAM protein [bacterium]
MVYKYLFGPVPSRRLGVSLGIDLIPYKTCTYDCIYCECGKTTDLTEERKEYVPTDDVIKELDHFLSGKPSLDYVTFSGSGEPTLHSGIGRIIDFLKREYPEYKIAILTNGSLFCDPAVRKAVRRTDLVMPSLDAVSPLIFEQINRPKTNDPERIIDGLIKFRSESEAQIWLELFIVPELNDSEEELSKIKEALNQIDPDIVQLNTLDRPGTESWVEPATTENLRSIAQFLKPLKVEAVELYDGRRKFASFNEDIARSIFATVNRRPCTANDLSQILGLNLKEINKYLQTLLEEKKITYKEEKRGIFYIGTGNERAE